MLEIQRQGQTRSQGQSQKRGQQRHCQMRQTDQQLERAAGRRVRLVLREAVRQVRLVLLPVS